MLTFTYKCHYIEEQLLLKGLFKSIAIELKVLCLKKQLTIQ